MFKQTVQELRDIGFLALNRKQSRFLDFWSPLSKFLPVSFALRQVVVDGFVKQGLTSDQPANISEQNSAAVSHSRNEMMMHHLKIKTPSAHMSCAT